ncbi:hypothetical protein SCUCBS95973_004204 [Sporothrix curviconia]|uniref:Threonylcarbamoyl-AMP synthase n=1 Tax=Sporothrix curviconia TaxID=1260050 RepID=A0ABP0BLR6_9PEZI
MYKTRILPVPDPDSLGRFRPPTSTSSSSAASPLDHWDAAESAPGLDALVTAAGHIRNTDVPVGFPTETVYGLGADATRSGAVRGIFSVKGRPSDNPLIVHVCDLDMLRELCNTELPAIYRPLVEKFWPGPLTILLPVPEAAKYTLAPEVTAGLSTFGARLPASPLTRTLIRLADAPLAGPSANASTRPSPTTAQHVVDDLNGRIEVVLDGGACGVGVESTVVDGLCEPPVILRPGGISLADLRTVPGWEKVERAYHDVAHGGNAQKDDKAQAAEDTLKPRAPGMKYKHYSPKARVVLYEGGKTPVLSRDALIKDIEGAGQQASVVGVVRTSTWPKLTSSLEKTVTGLNGAAAPTSSTEDIDGVVYHLETYSLPSGPKVFELYLGRDLSSIAHGLFSALRDLDARGAEVILIEGIDDGGDDMAAAVMNRLRKAASEVR